MRILVVIIGVVVVLFAGMIVYRMTMSGGGLPEPASTDRLSDLPGTQNENNNLVEQSERQNADFMAVAPDTNPTSADTQNQRLERDKQDVLQQDLRDQQQQPPNQLPEPIQNSVKPVKLNKNY